MREDARARPAAHPPWACGSRLGPTTPSDRSPRSSRPCPGRALPSPDAIRAIAHDLTEEGYEQAITVALSPTEQAPFLDAGFALHERLHLLTHDLATVPPRIAPKPAAPPP